MTINGTNISETLTGTSAADSIMGYDGNDTINGGAGNDTINGGYGNNTYIFGKGDGLDILQSYADSTAWDGTTNGKLNTLQFKSGVAVSDVKAVRSGNDLIFNILGLDTLKVETYFQNGSYGQYNPFNITNPLQQVKFTDGTTWSFDDINKLAFAGTTGNDSILGTDWDDTMDGGAGNDTINGGYGNNTYLFGKGDGINILQSYGDSTAWDGTTNGKLNTLQFKAGVAISDVSFARSGNNLIISILGSDTLKVENFFMMRITIHCSRLFLQAGKNGVCKISLIMF